MPGSPGAPSASDDADAQQLIPALCRQFYQLGWVTGTGGGISVRVGERVFIAPSGVQKERIEREDLFMLDRQTQSVLQRPRNGALKPSACTPLFFNAYELHDAGACIHTHSKWAMLVTMAYGSEFRINHQEMIKGIAGHGYRDELIVPIIENTPSEVGLLRACPFICLWLTRRCGLTG